MKTRVYYYDAGMNSGVWYKVAEVKCWTLDLDNAPDWQEAQVWMPDSEDYGFILTPSNAYHHWRHLQRVSPLHCLVLTGHE